MTAAERNEVFCVASFRIVPRRQKPAFGVGALSRLVQSATDWLRFRLDGAKQKYAESCASPGQVSMLPTCEQIEMAHDGWTPGAIENKHRVDAPTGELLGDRSSGASPCT
jgi:hypothetical protein